MWNLGVKRHESRRETVGEEERGSGRGGEYYQSTFYVCVKIPQ
jgi:hypothetical protein